MVVEYPRKSNQICGLHTFAVTYDWVHRAHVSAVTGLRVVQNSIFSTAVLDDQWKFPGPMLPGVGALKDRGPRYDPVSTH